MKKDSFKQYKKADIRTKTDIDVIETVSARPW